jgi:hypothetical protein
MPEHHSIAALQRNREFNGWAGEPSDLRSIRGPATSVAKDATFDMHMATPEAPPL